jgi:hypothetical protein
LSGFFEVGMAGFEPAASTSQMWRDTGLRYIPNFIPQSFLISLSVWDCKDRNFAFVVKFILKYFFSGAGNLKPVYLKERLIK